MTLQGISLASQTLLCRSFCRIDISLATWRCMEPGACAVQATAEGTSAKASAIAAGTPSEPIESPSELAPSDRIEDSDKEGATRAPQPIAGQEASHRAEFLTQSLKALPEFSQLNQHSEYHACQNGNTGEARSSTCSQLPKAKQRVPVRRRTLQQSRGSPRAVHPRQSMQMSWQQRAWLLKSLKRRQPQKADP